MFVPLESSWQSTLPPSCGVATLHIAPPWGGRLSACFRMPGTGSLVGSLLVRLDLTPDMTCIVAAGPPMGMGNFIGPLRLSLGFSVSWHLMHARSSRPPSERVSLPSTNTTSRQQETPKEIQKTCRESAGSASPSLSSAFGQLPLEEVHTHTRCTNSVCSRRRCSPGKARPR